MIDCDPCNCIEGYYRDEQSWRKAMIVLLCDIETSLENYINKSGKGVCDKLATLAATGSVLADAAQIVSRITIVSGADDTKGVKLPTDAPSGAIYRVINPDTMYQVAFYPGSSSHQFVNLDAGGGILISPMKTMSVVFDGTDTWYLISIGE